MRKTKRKKITIDILQNKVDKYHRRIQLMAEKAFQLERVIASLSAKPKTTETAVIDAVPDIAVVVDEAELPEVKA